jgi:hypothetical protein
MDSLKQQIENHLYEIYPNIYEPVYKMKKKLSILCGSDYNTRVCTFEKIGENKYIVDNSFLGFCKDIFLNPYFDYFSTFKLNEHCFHEITFEDIWKTINSYNQCRILNKPIFQNLDMKNFIELTDLKFINSTKFINSPTISFKDYHIPSFINKNNFIQGIKFGNSHSYTFIIELKDFFCIIQCKAVN